MEKHLLIAIVDALVSDAIKKLELREGPQGPRGLRGRDGNDFRLEENIDAIRNLILENLPKTFDLTEEQISLLKGERGERGLPGRDGYEGKDGKDFIFEEHAEIITNKINELCKELALKFEDFSPEQIESLRGPQGDKGRDGKDFVFEDHKEEISQIIDSVTPKFEDFTPEQIESLRGPRGQRGKAGKDFIFEDHVEELSELIEKAVPKFEDFTEDQIESLRGSQGQKGEAGKDFSFEESREEINNIIVSYFREIEGTLKLKFEDLTEDDKESLRGPRGQRGKSGRDFDLAESTPVIEQKVSEWLEDKKIELKLKFEDLTESDKDSLKLKFEHISPEDRLSLRGPRGQRGRIGIQGETGPNGKDGENGTDGKMGPRGLPGLSGKDGRNGRDGRDGLDGRDAPAIVDVEVEKNLYNKNAFKLVFELNDGTTLETPDIALPKGDTIFYYPAGVGGGGNGGGSGGTGEDGKSAYEIALDNGFVGTEVEWLESLVGPAGADGDPSGEGDSAYEIAVNNGFVGTEVEWLESLVGPQGPAGNDGADGTNGTDGINGTNGIDGADGTNGTDGINGTNGIDGADGISAYQVAVNNGFVGTEVEWLASLVGPQGPAGNDGADGTNGTDGINGVDGIDGADGTNGTDGINGVDGLNGLSAYEIAVDNGFVGTEVEWLESLQGSSGDGSYTVDQYGNFDLHLRATVREIILEDENLDKWSVKVDNDGALQIVSDATGTPTPINLQGLELASLTIVEGILTTITPAIAGENLSYLYLKSPNGMAWRLTLSDENELVMEDGHGNKWAIRDQLGVSLLRVQQTGDGAINYSKAFSAQETLPTPTPEAPTDVPFSFVMEGGVPKLKFWNPSTSSWMTVAMTGDIPVVPPSDNLPVGTILQSVLTEEEFLEEMGDPNGDRWTLMDATGMEETDRLRQIKGWLGVPNGKGVVLRGLEDGTTGRDPHYLTRIPMAGAKFQELLGSYQADMFYDHQHTAGLSHPTHIDPWGQYGTGNSTRYSGISLAGAPNLLTSPASYVHGSTITGSETRMKNMAVNFFIKYDR